MPIVISVLLGVGSGGLCPSPSALLRPNLDNPGVEFSTCLDEISMEISVLRDTGSGSLGPERSTLLRDDLGDRWPGASACLAGVSEFLAPRSWNFCVELVAVDLRRGFRGRLCGVEEFRDWSTSSTSKDRFKVGLVGSPSRRNLPLEVLLIPDCAVFLMLPPSWTLHRNKILGWDGFPSFSCG